MEKRPKYDQSGNRITNDYYGRKQQKEIDFCDFFKILGILAGLFLFFSYLSQMIK